MATPVRVESVDALKAFKAALYKFAEQADTALNDASSEMERTLVWLENEARTHWQTQIRKRTEDVGRAQERLRSKKLFKDSSGRTPSAVEEEKAVKVAQMRLAEAEQKLGNVKRYTPMLQKEIQLYRGGVQRLAAFAQSTVPQAAAALDGLVTALEQYMALATASGEVAGPTTAPAGPDQVKADEPPPTDG